MNEMTGAGHHDVRPGMITDLRRVLGLWRRHYGRLAAGALVSCLAALSGVALLGLAGSGVARGLHQGAAAAAVVSLVLLRPLILMRPAMRWTERMLTHSATFRALADTRVWFFRRLAERLPTGLGLHRAGDVLGRLVTDVEALDGLYLRVLAPIAAATTVVAAIAVTLGLAAPVLALMVVLPLLMTLVLPPLLAPGLARASAEVARARGELRARAVEPLMGLEDVLATNGEARAVASMDEAARMQERAERRLSSAGALGGAAGSLLWQLALLGAIAWGLAGGAEGAGVSLAVLALFLALAAGETLSVLPRAGAALASAGAAARRLFEAADAPTPAPEPGAPGPEPRGHAVSLRDVNFRWAEDREPVFAGLSLEIPEGGRVVLLGPSGVGKSTLAALLMRLALPQSGSITLGGVEIATLPADVVRRRIACLTQDARLFDDTIAANLRLAAPEAPDTALWSVLERARIADLVRALPDGLETRCGEGGARFSGGQARRLALARALLSPAQVLILDEPAAGLDSTAEREFLATLGEATTGRTVLLIVHRLTGVERPTRILRLAAGRALAAAG